MPIENFPVECFCDETPFAGFRWVYDREDQRYTLRRYEGRLTVTPEKMFANINSPNGIQLLWQHGGWRSGAGQSLGRVTEMEFEGRKLVGAVDIDEANLLAFLPGGFDALQARINTGLSVGLQFLDNPPFEWTLQKGTRDKPDKLVYNAVRIVEVSLTPVPRIYTAGLVPRDPGNDDESETEVEADAA